MKETERTSMCRLNTLSPGESRRQDGLQAVFLAIVNQISRPSAVASVMPTMFHQIILQM
jgi:hypothetical protein